MNPGKVLIAAGVILIIVGLVFALAGKVPWLGKLPGDIVIQRDSTTIHFPIVTSIVVSVLLTLILNFVLRVWR